MTPFFRDVRPDDSKLVWEWRNDVLTRKMSRYIEAVSWENHERWLATSLKTPSRILWFVQDKDLNIGIVRFDLAEDLTAEISVNLNPEHRRKGYGRIVLSQASKKFFEEYSDQVQKIIATIHRDNSASMHAFLKAGYVNEGGGDTDWIELFYKYKAS